MKYFLFLSLLIFASCATKYSVPGNRFLTPESQGGAFRGQAEFQQTQATQASLDISSGAVEGVDYENVNRMGFLVSNSLFDQLDLYWSHTGGGNSMIGGKFQFLGDSRSGKGAGHKMAAAVAFGQNDHETDNESVEFTLTGQEFLFLYGYRFTDMIMPYSSLSYGTYVFNGKISSSNPAINGDEPELTTRARSLSGGVELSLSEIFLKLEATYQQLSTTDTKDKTNFIIGYSLGFGW